MKRVRVQDVRGVPMGKEVREVPRMSLAQVGKKLGISHETVRVYEKSAFEKLWEGLQDLKMSEIFGPDAKL